jgi:enolase
LKAIIQSVQGREILDSRGYPTVEVDVILHSGHMGRMMVPSGASTGKFEAWELRDEEPERFQGKGVMKAVANINNELRRILVGKDASDQPNIDALIIGLDGSPNKSRLGANAILGVSLAAAHAAASFAGKKLYRYWADEYLLHPTKLTVPVPMTNMISGGLHAGKNVDLQDFLVIPIGAKTYKEALEMISRVYWKTKDILLQKGYIAQLLADEGGFGPHLTTNSEALDILCESMEKSGIRPGEDMAIALDVASSHFYDEQSGLYRLESEGRSLTSDEMIDMLRNWVLNYPILSIEDGLAEDDWEGWKRLTEQIGGRVQLIGDDLFTTNPVRIKKGISEKAGNSVLIKMNQIGTLTETVEAIRLAQSNGMTTVISARSGETEDTTLADLAVGLNGGQIKIGSLARSSRLSKYNQLLRIDEELAGAYAGSKVFKHKMV